MLNKPLEEEQADMRSRWADPAYRWANDSLLRRRYAKEYEVPNTGAEISSGMSDSGGEVTAGARQESEGTE
jgi:hypothetical protein